MADVQPLAFELAHVLAAATVRMKNT